MYVVSSGWKGAKFAKSIVQWTLLFESTPRDIHAAASGETAGVPLVPGLPGRVGIEMSRDKRRAQEASCPRHEACPMHDLASSTGPRCEGGQ
jgi:hypothetical protein